MLGVCVKVQLFFLRYDPTADLPTDVDTEQDRVIFIKSTAQFLVSSHTSIEITNYSCFCQTLGLPHQVLSA